MPSQAKSTVPFWMLYEWVRIGPAHRSTPDASTAKPAYGAAMIPVVTLTGSGGFNGSENLAEPGALRTSPKVSDPSMTGSSTVGSRVRMSNAKNRQIGPATRYPTL